VFTSHVKKGAYAKRTTTIRKKLILTIEELPSRKSHQRTTSKDNGTYDKTPHAEKNSHVGIGCVPHKIYPRMLPRRMYYSPSTTIRIYIIPRRFRQRKFWFTPCKMGGVWVLDHMAMAFSILTGPNSFLEHLYC
jgi:hypothetical protein